MNITIVNLQDSSEIQTIIECLPFINEEIINPNIDIYCNHYPTENLESNSFAHIFPLHASQFRLADLNLYYSKLKSHAKKGKYDIAVDTEGSLKSALSTYLLSGKTAGFQKEGFMGKIISKLYDETIPYNNTQTKRELTFKLLAKTFGFEKKTLDEAIQE